MNQYTKIPNQLFEESQLSVNQRYLFGLLLKFCGKKEFCYPGQKKLAKIMGCSTRNIRKHIKKLVDAELISIKKIGFNKSNTYKVSKELLVRNCSSSLSMDSNGNCGSPHLGTPVPLHMGTVVPPKSTYIKEKDKMYGKTSKGQEKCREKLIKMGFDIASKSNQNINITAQKTGIPNEKGI
jgi:hypothetical protein